MTDTINDTQNLLNRLKNSLLNRQPPYTEVAKSFTPMEVECKDEHKEISIVQDTQQAPVEFELWETLAYDLALANTDPQTIANAYDLTIEQLNQLQSNPYFAKILQAKKDEVKQLGTDATFAVKMRMVANRATPQLLRRLTDPSTANRDFLAMFKTVTELGQLIPQPSQDDSPQPTLIGASVTFNISGVPGLEHLSPTLVSDKDVIEAEFDEVFSELSTRYQGELGEL